MLTYLLKACESSVVMMAMHVQPHSVTVITNDHTCIFLKVLTGKGLDFKILKSALFAP